jgi:antitoxin component YwqK of YwqJK toxin-antitoxin module
MSFHFKNIFFVFFSLLIASANGKSVNLSDSIKTVKGNKTEIKILFNDGKVNQIIHLRDNKKHGVQKTFSNTGLLLSEIEYNKGLLCGKHITYNNEGGIFIKKSYQCNVKKNTSWLHGKYLEYSGKVLIEKGYYNDSLKEGKWLSYHANGILKTENNYKKGKLVGEQKHYNNKGNLNYKSTLVEITENGKTINVKHGAYVAYHNNGILSQEGSYEYDKKTGLWREYTPTGEVYRETFYKNGKVHGINNTYTNTGKPEIKCEYYEEIVIEGKKITNVYHGIKERYKNNGKLDSKEIYRYGKKEGTWESYHPNGNLSMSNVYKNNLQIGKSIAFDTEGNKIYDATYEIIKGDSIDISVKSGKEYRWQKNILVFETNYSNGKENGIRKSYYPSGNIASVQTIVDDLLQGESIEYYENGKIKSDRNYSSFLTASNEKKVNSTGWCKQSDENGTVQNKYYYDSLGNISVSYSYHNGMLSQMSINKVIELNYFPNGKILSEKIGGNASNMPFARYYYMNGNIRKIGFQNAQNLISNTLHFQSDGKYNFASGSFYNKPDTLVPEQYVISNILATAGGRHKPNKFYTDTIKNGNYIIYYNTGSKYAEMNFKSDLPHGNFIFYHPETKDTMLYAQFNNGLLNGDWLEKFGGRNISQRGKYCNNKMCSTWTRNQISGKPYEIRKYNAISGQSAAITEFYSNGLLKTFNDYESGAYEHRDEKGNLISRSLVLDEKLKKVMAENYYPNSNQIKSRNYYFNKVQDSISETYFESGKLQSTMPYKNGKRNGTYYDYFENGNLKRKTYYENDKLEGLGIIISEDGKIDTLYYKNNNLQVKPSGITCACIDTTHSSGRMGFAPMLNHLLDYSNLVSYMPKYLLAVDSLNYRSIFYTGFQNSNGNKSGFSSMNLMLFKEFAFYLPSNKQIKLIFNPCVTKGYISRMEIAANYGIGNRDYTNVDFYPKRIALEFVKGPVKSADKNYPNFKAFFDTKHVEFNPEKKIIITTRNTENDCFVPAVINQLLSIKVTKGKQYVFEEINPSAFSKYNLNLTQAELELFFGIVASEATVSFKIYGPKGYETINAHSDLLLLGGTYACGAIKIDCIKTQNEVYRVKEKETDFTVIDIKNALESKGFSRIKFTYDVASSQLWFTFYTE